MAEEFTDANEQDQDSSPEVETLMPVETSDGLISTQDFVVAEPSYDAEQNTSESDPEPAEKKEEENTPFHEHPRWKEVMKEREELRVQNEVLRRQQELKQAPDQPKASRFANKTDEQLLQEMTEDTKGFLGDLVAETIAETEKLAAKEQQAAAQTVMQKQNQNFEAFFKEGDREERLRSRMPEMKDLMLKHPEHNVISAFLELERENEIKAEVEKAVKAEREKLLKNQKAGMTARSLSSGSAYRPPATGKDDRLSNPDKYGGTSSVLYQRMKERMGS